MEVRRSLLSGKGIALGRPCPQPNGLPQELMRPGEVYEMEIRPFPTANVFKKGHRIRVDISSSNFPRFDVNPNTGEPLGQNRQMIKADNTIYNDALRASHVVLSLGPTRA